MNRTPSALSVARSMNTLLEGAYWPASLETRTAYSRTQDDTDGELSGHDLMVSIGPDGDAWVQTPQVLRFRTYGGGGHSLRVRNALLVLAEAIRRDNAEFPQRGAPGAPGVEASSTRDKAGANTPTPDPEGPR